MSHPALHDRPTPFFVTAPQVSRGLKPTPHQNPAITIGQPTIAIVALHKEVPRQHNVRAGWVALGGWAAHLWCLLAMPVGLLK